MNKYIISQINHIVKERPKVCIILGSGLNSFINLIENKRILSYKNIKGFLQTTVSGHKGEFIYGNINKTPILCANGRYHYYEGYSFKEVGILIEIFKHYDPRQYIITNSSGCLRLDWDLGTFMLVDKFIDFSFIDSNQIIKYELNNISIPNLNIYRGTYVYTIGPTYETRAEIKEIININGDVVGMSTFPEYIMCKELNINPIIISCLTNYGAGLQKKGINHKDVLLNANKVKDKFSKLIIKIIEDIELQKKQKK